MTEANKDRDCINPQQAFDAVISSLRETAELSLEIVFADPTAVSDPSSEAARHQRIAKVNTEFVARTAILQDEYERRLVIAINPHLANKSDIIDEIIKSQRKNRLR